MRIVVLAAAAAFAGTVALSASAAESHLHRSYLHELNAPQTASVDQTQSSNTGSVDRSAEQPCGPPPASDDRGSYAAGQYINCMNARGTKVADAPSILDRPHYGPPCTPRRAPGTQLERPYAGHLCPSVSAPYVTSGANVGRPVGDYMYYPQPRLESSSQYHSSWVPLDWCRAGGGDCGQAAADAFCAQVDGGVRPHAVPRRFGEQTGVPSTLSIGDHQSCNTGSCNGFAFISCGP